MLKDRTQIEKIGQAIEEQLAAQKMTKAELNRRSRVYRPVIDKIIKGEDYNISSLVSLASAMNLVITIKPKKS